MITFGIRLNLHPVLLRCSTVSGSRPGRSQGSLGRVSHPGAEQTGPRGLGQASASYGVEMLNDSGKSYSTFVVSGLNFNSC